MMRIGLAVMLVMLAGLACAEPTPTPIPMTVQEYAAFQCGGGVLETVDAPSDDAVGLARAHVMSLERVEPPAVLHGLHAASLDFARALVRAYEASADTDEPDWPAPLPETEQAFRRLRDAEQVLRADADLLEAWYEGCPLNRR